MLNAHVEDTLNRLAHGTEVGLSPWLTVTQSMIDDFGHATLDPDPMHIDPEWCKTNSPFGETIAFGFFTISLLTHLMHSAMKVRSAKESCRTGYYLNYGFDRVRLVAPVRNGSRVRGRFTLRKRTKDGRGRWLTAFDCTVEIEGEARPALVAQWLTIWVPPQE